MHRAFTLIELLVAIVIISVLVGTIWYQVYKPTHEKAVVETDALIPAKNCMASIISYCINHPGQAFSLNQFVDCQNYKSLYGYISFYAENTRCTQNGTLDPNFLLEVSDNQSDTFKVVCKIQNEGFKCTIESF
jgi:prepilin-type N-terminal cleavage/methylation domain-containing protein